MPSLKRRRTKWELNCLKLAETTRNYSLSLSSCTARAALHNLIRFILKLCNEFLAWKNWLHDGSKKESLELKIYDEKLRTRFSTLSTVECAIVDELDRREQGARKWCSRKSFLNIFVTFSWCNCDIHFYDLFRISS